MILNEAGVLPDSVKYYHTPSDLAKSILFYLTRCGHYFCDENYTYSSRTEAGRQPSRRTFLLIYIVSGQLDMVIDGQSYSVHAGHIALLDCRKPHEYHSPGALEFFWLHLDGTNSRQFYNMIIQMNGQMFSIPVDKGFAQTFREIIISCDQENSLSEIRQSQLIYRLLCDLILPEYQLGSEHESSPISQSLKYMHEHLCEDLSVNDIADQVNMSSSHFSRIFRNQTGNSPHEYIMLKRLDQAKFLLCTTNLSIKEISFTVGYHNEANFVHAFTQKVGMSPGRYRKQPY